MARGTEVEIHPLQPSAEREHNPRDTAANGEHADRSAPSAEADSDEAWLNTPEAITDWLKWYDALEPLVLTPAEEADTQAWLKKLDAHSISKIGKRVEDVFP